MAVLRFRTSSTKQNKFRARKVRIDDITFDSIKESERYKQLRLLLVAGQITDLEVHPRIPLIVNEKKIGYYVGDFRYLDHSGKVIIEDVKSPVTKTAVYRLKKKILEAQSPPVVITEIMSI